MPDHRGGHCCRRHDCQHPDTVGYSTPTSSGNHRHIIERVPNSTRRCFRYIATTTWVLPCQFPGAVMHGPRQVECTINGLESAPGMLPGRDSHGGEDAQDYFPCSTGLDTTEIVNCSKLVSKRDGFPGTAEQGRGRRQRICHEAGIHQDGVIKSRETYEIMRAQDVGWSTNRLVLGKHSGRNAFRKRLKEIGFEFSSEEELNSAFVKFKELADKKHEIYDEDLQAIVTDNMQGDEEMIKLLSLKVVTETGETPMPN